MSGVFLIAEAGVNHNGSLKIAKKLVEEAARAGADAVKFQTFRTEKLVCRTAPKARYQRKNTGEGGSQFAMLKKLELSEKDHKVLLRHCRRHKIQFLSTPFDPESLRFLDHRLKIPLLKLGSGEITNAPLLLDAARTKKPIILSTGMSSLEEVRRAVSVIAFGYLHPNREPGSLDFARALTNSRARRAIQKKLILLHCTTEYPTPFSEVNLRAMETLREAFGVRVGLSDHTEGIAVAVAAVARGACVIEKHFTLNRNLPGPDHKASLEPDQLRELAISIRRIESALGSTTKTAGPSEKKNRPVARKSLVAAETIRRGEKFTAQNLTVKRPGNGRSPFDFWSLLGKRAQKTYRADELIREKP